MNKMCSCGCGKEVVNEKDKFIHGHNSKIRIMTEKERINRSIAHTGHIVSNETRLKISKSGKGKSAWNKGLTCSAESISKMIKNHKGGVKKHSSETILKMSLSAVKRIRQKLLEDNIIMCPNEGKNEKLILDCVQQNSNVNFIRNDHVMGYQIGRFPDGYISKYNLVVEILEKHHFKRNGELSDNDKHRESIIASKLNCMLYYISEKEFLNDSDAELKRFNNFIHLLNEGIN